MDKILSIFYISIQDTVRKSDYMQIGWIDFSKKDRDKVFAVIDALTEPEAVDELGIGAIRDGFSDTFFPGTSTIQTRAKYFVLIPYIMKNAMHGCYGDSENSILEGINDEEENCAKQMMQDCSDASGILGWRIIRRGGWLVRPPSLIYWNGLKKFKILNYIGNIRSYAKFVAENLKNKADNKKLLKMKETDDDDGDDNDAYSFSNLRIFADGLPYSKDWKDKLSISLNAEEALFLEQRIKETHPQSLLYFLIKQKQSTYGASTFEDLYEKLKTHNTLTEELKNKMLLAVKFSKFMRVGFAAYNLVLAGEKETKVAKKANEIIEKAKQNLNEITDINLDEVFAINENINYRLKNFLCELLKFMKVNDLEGMKKCVKEREIYLKKSRANVFKAGSFVKWEGLDILYYRLDNVRRILNDIKEGMNV